MVVSSSSIHSRPLYDNVDAGETASRLASVVFYCFPRSTITAIRTFAQTAEHSQQQGFGVFISHLAQQTDVYGLFFFAYFSRLVIDRFLRHQASRALSVDWLCWAL